MIVRVVRRPTLLLGLLLIVDPASAQSSFTREGVWRLHAPANPAIALPDDGPVPGVVAEENLVYAERDGAPLALDLYRPAGAGPFAAVLVVHGGGWEAGDRTMERPLARQLAARGWAAATVSYRLGEAGRFPASLHDVKAAVRWLRAHAVEHRIDAARIGAVGGSAGGQLVALLGATNGRADREGPGPWLGHSSAVQAVVVIDGAADFTDPRFIAEETARRGATTRHLGGSWSERSAVWEAASARRQLGPASAPALFLTSATPPSRFWSIEETSAALRALGRDSAVIPFPDAPHPFWLFHPWFDRVVAHIDAFFRQHLADG